MDKNQESNYSLAGKIVAELFFGFNIPTNVLALVGSPAKLEAAAVTLLAGGLAVKLYCNPDYNFCKSRDMLSVEQALLHLVPGDKQERKLQFIELFKYAYELVKHYGQYVQALALAIANDNLGKHGARKLGKQLCFGPIERGESCFGCAGGSL
jgi:hypothetical protein